MFASIVMIVLNLFLFFGFLLTVFDRGVDFYARGAATIFGVIVLMNIIYIACQVI